MEKVIATFLPPLILHFFAFICISNKQKTPVNVAFTGVCFDLLLEK